MTMVRRLLSVLLPGGAALFVAALPAAAQDRESPVPAASPGARARVAHIEARSAALDSLAALPGRLRLYARVPGWSTPVMVRASMAWPDDTETAYTVLADSARRVVRGSSIPMSLSGDWFTVYTHTFNDAGRVVRFVRLSRFFIGCPGPGKGTTERTVSYFGAGGRLLAREYELSAAGESIDPRRCEFLYRHPYRIHRTRDALLRSIGMVR